MVPCGGRKNAYESYVTAVENGEAALLLVDSETAVAAQNQQGEPTRWKPWVHLKARQGDGWDKPKGASDLQCHLMVQVMESWFLADRETLASFFGQGFKPNQLPNAANPIESVAKESVYASLQKASKDCKIKAAYGKGAHSFKLLKVINPDKVVAGSPWAKRLIDHLRPTRIPDSEPAALADNSAQADLALSEQQQAIIRSLQRQQSAKQLQKIAGDKGGTHGFRSREIGPLLNAGLIEMTLPGKPKSPRQEYRLTERGIAYQQVIEKMQAEAEPDEESDQ